MGTPARERMRIWREKMKAAGYRELNVWLSPQALGHLEERVSEKEGQSRRDAVSGSIEEALIGSSESVDSSLQEPKDNPLAEDQESVIANLKATVRRLLRQRVTLTDPERDSVDMAARYLSEKQKPAEKHTATQLREMLERIETETEEQATMIEAATVTRDEAEILIEVAEILERRRQAGHREMARTLRELAARFGAGSSGKVDRDPNTVDWLGNETA